MGFIDITMTYNLHFRLFSLKCGNDNIIWECCGTIWLIVLAEKALLLSYRRGPLQFSTVLVFCIVIFISTVCRD